MSNPKQIITPSEQPAMQSDPRANDSPNFGVLVRRYRVAAGLTQEALAARSTLSVRAISYLEQGASARPQRETVRLLADALDLTEAECAPFEAAARVGDSQQAASPLPAPPTPLIGRAEALAALCTMLRQGTVRLLTVTGPGGVGKTRLALEVAARLLLDFSDGVFFLPLAIMREPGLVPSAVAQAMGVSESARRPADEGVFAAIGPKRPLIVLDNCEHLIAAGPFVAALLAACPSARILATSREPLHIRSEHVYPLPPLALPSRQQTWDVAALSRSPAVALFVDRAAAASAHFALSPANAAAVAGICHRLDGLPLAIELAAARTRLLSPGALLQRLERRLPLLTGGAQDLPERQRTMRAAIAWSCDLLTDAERALFRRLAVFAGGFTLEAVEEIVATLDGTAEPVLDTLTSLVDKSLVSTDDIIGVVRYAMLETVSEFGLAELAAAGEAAMTEQAHAVYFLALAEAAEPALTGEKQAIWLDRLDTERDNLRAALGQLIERKHAELALRFGWGLWRFWLIRGHFTEGRARLGEIAALDAAGPYPLLLADVQFGAGMLASAQGDAAAARAAFEAFRDTAQRMGDRYRISAACAQLGLLADSAAEFAAARTLSEESLAIRRILGEPWHIAISLMLVGKVALHQRDYENARVRLAESVHLFRHLGDRLNLASALRTLAQLSLAQQDIARAHSLVCESLGHTHALGQTLGIAACLEIAAEIVLIQALPRHAATLLGAAGALRDATDARPQWEGGAALDRLLEETHAALGAEGFSAAWETGRGLSLEDAVAAVIAIAPSARADGA